MPSLAFRKASICSRFSFSASCTLVVNPQHAICSRLILYWKLSSPSGSSCIGKDCHWHRQGISHTLVGRGLATKQPENSLTIRSECRNEVANGKVGIESGQPMKNTCGVPKREDDQRIHG